MKNLISLGLISFFSMNLAVFAETIENNNSASPNMDSFDNLSVAKKNAVSTKSFMLDTVLSFRQEPKMRVKGLSPKSKDNPKNRVLKDVKPDSREREKSYLEKVKEKRKRKNPNPDKYPNGTLFGNSSEKRTNISFKDAKKNSSESAFFAKKGVIISDKIAPKVGVISNEYKKLTREKLIITSANRTPSKQAVAMLQRIEKLGEMRVQKLYKNKVAVGQILDAYRQNRGNRSATIKAMTQVIETQIANGVYISRHLRQGAIDVSGNSQPQALRSAVGKAGGTVFFEYDHFHVNLPIDNKG